MFVSKGPGESKSALIQVLAWYRTGTNLGGILMKMQNISTCVKKRHWKFRLQHDDVIKWKYFPLYWPFVWGIHRSPVNSPHKGQWRGALMFSFICVWINGWVNNRKDGDLRRYRPHCDVIVMIYRPLSAGPSVFNGKGAYYRYFSAKLSKICNGVFICETFWLQQQRYALISECSIRFKMNKHFVCIRWVISINTFEYFNDNHRNLLMEVHVCA